MGRRARSSARTAPPKPIVFYILMFLIMVTPLPLGSFYQWSWAGLAIALASLLIWDAFTLLKTDALQPALPRGLILPAMLFGLAVVWGLLQASSVLPDSWYPWPWQATERTLGDDVSGTVSLAPYQTQSSVLRLMAYGALFWLLLRRITSRAHLKLALQMFVAAACAYAIYGLAMTLAGPDTILWFEKHSYRGNVTSTFVNRNAYATYAGFGLLAALALLLRRLSHAAQGRGRGSAIITSLFVGHARETVALLLALAILLSALLLSASRGGVLATVVALGTLLLVYGCGPRAANRATLSWVILLFVVVGAGFIFLAGQVLGVRFLDSGAALATRWDFYQTMMQAVTDRPLEGYGLGGFLDVFYLYNDGRFVKRWSFGHNAILDLVVEMGLPACLLLVLSVSMIALRCGLSAFRSRSEPIYGALGFATFVLVAVQGMVDFTLIIPAIAVTFVFLLALGQEHVRADERALDQSDQERPEVAAGLAE